MFASTQVPFGRVARLACLALTLGALANVSVAKVRNLDQCTVVHTKLIGESKNVVMETLDCGGGADLAPEVSGGLEARQSNNVCGAPCATTCFTPAGGGPDPNDCSVISNAILFDSQNIGNDFTLAPAPRSLVTFNFNSCQGFFENLAFTNLTYCRTDFAALVDILAFNCQATQNAHGGMCEANDQRWFAQVQIATAPR